MMHHPELMRRIMHQHHQARLDEAERIRSVHRLERSQRWGREMDKMLNAMGTWLVRLGRRLQRRTWQRTRPRHATDTGWSR